MKSTEFDKQKEKTLNNPRYAVVKPKKNIKAKHKHDYHEVIIFVRVQNAIYSNKVDERAFRTRICLHCGKIHGLDFLEEIKKNGGRFYGVLDRNEMVERYPHLLVFDMGENVYKHTYDIENEGYIDIRTMYQQQVAALTNKELSEEDITNCLLGNIKPEVMANILENKKEEK